MPLLLHFFSIRRLFKAAEQEKFREIHDMLIENPKTLLRPYCSSYSPLIILRTLPGIM